MHRLARLAVLGIATLAVPSFVAAQQEPAGMHAHHGAAGSALVGQLKLNAGQRWATDASLRTGMAEIRKAFDVDHGRIHAGTQTDAQYDALASRIDAAVKGIVAQCKLAPDADAQLHFIVGDLMQGVSLMRGADPQRSRHDGAALVHGALRAYPAFFDDPDWRPETAPPGKH